MNNIVIKVKGYSAKLQSTETLPTGQLDYTKVKFVIDESDTVWNDATLTATFSSLMPTGQRKTLPATVNADGEAIVPEKILSTKGAEFTAGLCGSWASGARIATNMVTVCKLLPGAAGDDLQDGLNNAIVNEEDVYNYIDEKSHIHDGEIDALGEAAENHEDRIDTLEETMPTKANLVNGKVPSSELPSNVSAFQNDAGYITESKYIEIWDNGNLAKYTKSQIELMFALKKPISYQGHPVLLARSEEDGSKINVYYLTSADGAPKWNPIVYRVSIDNQKNIVLDVPGKNFFSGSYNDLTDKPATELTTEELVSVCSDFATIISVNGGYLGVDESTILAF